MICFQNSEKIKSIPVIQIEPSRSQPRTSFSREALTGLANSIRENGILQPISVRKVFASKFELIAGERRLRAAIMAGFKTVPCLVINCDDTQAAVFSLLENLQRSNLNMFEEAEAIQNLIQNWGLTQDLLAKKLGKNQSTIANKLRLLKLNNEERKMIVEGNLTERHARTILRLKDDKQRECILREVILKGLNVCKTEILVDSVIKCVKSDENFDINKNFEEKLSIINTAIDSIDFHGLEVSCLRNEDEEHIEYVIKISKEGLKVVESA